MSTWMQRGMPSVLVAATILSVIHLAAAENDTARMQIGTYDSRLVAYAHFWTDAHQRKLKDMTSNAQRAKTAGDNDLFRQLDAALRAEQDRIHLQVFSTAPVTEILDEQKELVSKVQNEAHVTQLLSQWDEDALKGHASAERTDVTDLLLAGFKLTEKQQQVVSSMRKQKPLSIEEAKRLLKAGKL